MRYVTMTLLLLLACSRSPTDAGERVRIRTVSSRYAPGAAAVVTLTNVGGQVLGYAACPVELQRYNGSEWEDYNSKSGFTAEPCDMIILRLRPGEEDTVTFLLPAQLPDGSYRFRLENVLGVGESVLPRESRISNGFTVTRSLSP